MIVAWMIFASVGVLMPRYFKPAWPQRRWFDKQIWFMVSVQSSQLYEKGCLCSKKLLYQVPQLTSETSFSPTTTVSLHLVYIFSQAIHHSTS